jgi:hypothetical protein
VNGEVHGGRPRPTGAVVPRGKKKDGGATIFKASPSLPTTIFISKFRKQVIKGNVKVTEIYAHVVTFACLKTCVLTWTTRKLAIHCAVAGRNVESEASV